MRKKEVVLVENGQIKPGSAIPDIFNILRGEKTELALVFFKYISTAKEIRSQNIDISYFFRDIFRGMVEEKFVSEVEPTEFLRQTFQKLKDQHSGISRFSIEPRNGDITIRIFLAQPNWELEESIYDAYGQILDKFQTCSFTLRLTESFERQK